MKENRRQKPQDENLFSISYERIWLLAGGILYPSFSLFMYLVAPTIYDDGVGRFTIGVLFFLLPFTLQFFIPWLQKHLTVIREIGMVVMISHYNFMIYESGSSETFLIGSILVIAACSMSFLIRPKGYFIYTATNILGFIAAIELSNVIREDRFVVFGMILVIHIVSFISIMVMNRQKKSLIKAEVENFELMRKLLTIDPVSQLPNKNRFYEMAPEIVQLHKETKKPYSVVFIDLDHFKPANDTFGHSAGDFILLEAGKRIQKSLRDSDFVARYGGDEFIVLLSNPMNPEVTLEIGQRILRNICCPYEIEDVEKQVDFITASIGIKYHNVDDTHTLEENIAFADQAVYKAKDSGRNAVKVWDSSVDVWFREQRSKNVVDERGSLAS